MCRLTKCCCCFPLYVGVYIIGSLNIIGVIMQVPLLAYLYHLGSQNLNIGFLADTKFMTYQFGNGIAYSLVLLMVNVILLKGPFKNTKVQLVPWMTMIITLGGVSVVGMIAIFKIPEQAKNFKLMADIVRCVVFLFPCIHLIIGTYQKRKLLLLPWMALSLVSCGMYVVILILALAAPDVLIPSMDPFIKMCDPDKSYYQRTRMCHEHFEAIHVGMQIGSIVTAVLSFMFQIYFFSVVRSFYNNDCSDSEKVKTHGMSKEKHNEVRYSKLGYEEPPRTVI